MYDIKIQDISNSIKECYIDKLNGLIDVDEYSSIVSELKKEKADYELVISKYAKSISELEKEQIKGFNPREIIEGYIKLEHLTRDIVETMIDSIVVYRRIPNTRYYPIEIHWNF